MAFYTEEFVSYLLEALNNKRHVLSKAGRVNSFSPELSSKVRLAEHRSCSLNQRAVESFRTPFCCGVLTEEKF